MTELLIILIIILALVCVMTVLININVKNTALPVISVFCGVMIIFCGVFLGLKIKGAEEEAPVRASVSVTDYSDTDVLKKRRKKTLKQTKLKLSPSRKLKLRKAAETRCISQNQAKSITIHTNAATTNFMNAPSARLLKWVLSPARNALNNILY